LSVLCRLMSIQFILVWYQIKHFPKSETRKIARRKTNNVKRMTQTNVKSRTLDESPLFSQHPISFPTMSGALADIGFLSILFTSSVLFLLFIIMSSTNAMPGPSAFPGCLRLSSTPCTVQQPSTTESPPTTRQIAQ
jgi:hypothetical protein